MIAVIVIFLLSGGVFAWQYFGVPKEVKLAEEVLQGEAASWKTYRNEEFAFELTHPTNWKTAIDYAYFVPDADGKIVGVDPIIYAYKDEAPEHRKNVNITFVAVLPLGRDGPPIISYGEGRQISAQITSEEAKTNTEFLLTDGRAFGYRATDFATLPPSWRSYGSLYGRVEVSNLVLIKKEDPRIYSESASGVISEEDLGTVKTILSTFRFLDKGSAQNIEKTSWREYVLERITDEYNSLDFMDRRLVGIRDDGQRDVIITSIRTLMGWEKVPREAGHYPVKVSFPPYSSKIYFVKYMAGSGHSVGLYQFDVKSLTYRELPNAGNLYEDYNNIMSRIAPDGFRIASLGGDTLFLLDLLRDEVKILAKAQAGEVFFVAQEVPDFKWTDDNTIQYPVSSAKDFSVIVAKQIKIDMR